MNSLNSAGMPSKLCSTSGFDMASGFDLASDPCVASDSCAILRVYVNAICGFVSLDFTIR